MKKVFLALAVASLAFSGLAGTGDDEKKSNKPDPDKFCAEFKDGVLYVLHNGERMKEDVKLSNGMIVHTDAVIQKKDKSVIVMKDGQCITKDGLMDWKEAPKNKAPRTKSKKAVKDSNNY